MRYKVRRHAEPLRRREELIDTISKTVGDTSKKSVKKLFGNIDLLRNDTLHP